MFSGDIGFRTIFNGAEFSMEKLGYGLNTKNEFKVNGVKATGSFDTAKLMALELASISGEVNTFKGEERYAFELELNASTCLKRKHLWRWNAAKRTAHSFPTSCGSLSSPALASPLCRLFPSGSLTAAARV